MHPHNQCKIYAYSAHLFYFFAGSEAQLVTMLQQVGMEPILCTWSTMTTTTLAAMQGYVIVGCHDTILSSRVVLGQLIERWRPFLHAQSHAGKPIVGIGDGAYIIVEMGLVPGLTHDQLGMALVADGQHGAHSSACAAPVTWHTVCLTAEYQRGAFTHALRAGDKLSMPVVTKRRCFMVPPALWLELIQQGLPVLEYCDVMVAEHAHAGTVEPMLRKQVAAVSNKAGNVLAMVPQPECSPDGQGIFAAMRAYAASVDSQKVAVIPLYYQARFVAPPLYRPTTHTKPDKVSQLLLHSVTDQQEAERLQTYLLSQHIHVSIACYKHWEVWCETDELARRLNACTAHRAPHAMTLQQLLPGLAQGTDTTQQSIGQEYGVQITWHAALKGYLVRARGAGAMWWSRDQYRALDIPGVLAIWQSQLWCIDVGQLPTTVDIQHLLYSGWLFNPYESVCYEYAAYQQTQGPEKQKTHLPSTLDHKCQH